MGFKFISKEKIEKLPKESGVYCFKGGGEILYIGKASNIRERVKNHFQQPSYRDYLFLDKVEKIGFIKTNSEFAEPSAHLTSHPASQGSTIEALILEANLIKKYQPKYNVIWKDDKNYFFVGITKEDFPRIFLTHQLKAKSYKLKADFIGPFVDGKALKQALKVLRKVFPYRSCKRIPKHPCLWYQLDRCPAPCLTKSNIAKEINLETKLKKECQRNAENLLKILQGKKRQVLNNLKREMKLASKNQEFERAAKIRDQIRALEKILEHARIFEPLMSDVKFRRSPEFYDNWETIEKELKTILKTENKISRIEAYDVSNIQGKEATGSMVTFINGFPDKNFYRRFKIKISGKPNDVAMIKEVLARRFKHSEWPYPDLILIDGGRAQLNAAKLTAKSYKLKAKVMALAKKKNELFIENRKEPILLKKLPREIFNLILQLRDEAHRFAISYHQKLRKKVLFEK